MSIVQIIKRVASIGRDVARDAVDHNSEFIEQVAKRVEEVKQQELPKINQEIRNARVIGEMAIKIGLGAILVAMAIKLHGRGFKVLA